MKLLLLRGTENVTSISVFCGVLRRVLQTSLYFLQSLGTPRSKMKSTQFLLNPILESLPHYMILTLSSDLLQLLQLATICLTGPDTPVTHFSPSVCPLDCMSSILQEV